MANVSDKRSGEIIRKVFEVLIDNPDGMQAKEIISRVEKLLELTEFERSFYPKAPNIRRFDKILRFSTIGPVKAGWLVKSKGIWTLTEEGKKAYTNITDPEKLMKEARKLYYKWKESQQRRQRWARISMKVTKWQSVFLACMLPYLDSITSTAEQHLALIVSYPLVALCLTPWRLIFRILDRFVPTFHRFVERLRGYRQQVLERVIEMLEQRYPQLPEDAYEYEDSEQAEQADGPRGGP